MDVQQAHTDLIAVANRFGADENYSRAGGGNASVKHDCVLHIKPSGVALATLRDEDLVPLDLATLLDALVTDFDGEGDPVRVAAEAARIGDASGRRPSVEILFHALIPDALVLHLHPIVANGITCAQGGREVAARILGEEAVWVDYIDPGVPLAKGIAAAREEFEQRTGRPAPRITLLGNHGIIVSGNTADEVAERITWLTDTVLGAVGAASVVDSPGPDDDQQAPSAAESFRLATGAAVVASAGGDFVGRLAGASAAPVHRGPLIPDQIVYAGSLPVVLESAADDDSVASAVRRFEAEHGRLPVVAVLPGEAVIAVGDSPAGARTALATFIDALRVAAIAEHLGGVRVMDERERGFIENWEAESYRKSIAKEANG